MNAVILDNKKGGGSSSSKNFGGVRYNTNKMDNGKGELMAIRNFGQIQNDTQVRPEDVKQYLQSVANLNPKVSKKQFHASISCKGREYDKHQLTEVAHEWAKKMGYGDNPYIVVFHNDTDNNHVHIVSTRVNAQTGKKISDSMENVRAVKFIDQIVKEKYGIDRALEKQNFNDYKVSTIPQFKLLYELTGHTLSENDGILNIYKRGTKLFSHNIKDLQSRIQGSIESSNRKAQLKAIFAKYLPDFDASICPVHEKRPGDREGEVKNYRSDFTEFMRERFGLQFVFHFKNDKTPYGYTIVDHKSKAVFKGGGIMTLTELTKSPDHKVKLTHLEKQRINLEGYNIDSLNHIRFLSKKFKVPAYQMPTTDRVVTNEEKSYYKDLLSLFLKKNDVSMLGDLNIELAKSGGQWFVVDPGAKLILDAEDVLPKGEYESLEHSNEEQLDHIPHVGLSNPLLVVSGLASSLGGASQNNEPDRKKKKKR